MTRRLTRATDQAKVLGVCAGLAEYFEMDPVLMRVFFIAMAVFSAGLPMVVFYLLAALIMPKAGRPTATP